MTTTLCRIDAFTVNVTFAYNTTKPQKNKEAKFGHQSHIFFETDTHSMMLVGVLSIVTDMPHTYENTSFLQWSQLQLN